MRIKVCTKKEFHDPLGNPFYYSEDFYFNLNDNTLTLEGTSWRKNVENMEDGLNNIKKYFYGTNYHIVDLVRMLN